MSITEDYLKASDAIEGRIHYITEVLDSLIEGGEIGGYSGYDSWTVERGIFTFRVDTSCNSVNVRWEYHWGIEDYTDECHLSIPMELFDNGSDKDLRAYFIREYNKDRELQKEKDLAVIRKHIRTFTQEYDVGIHEILNEVKSPFHR